MNRRDILRAIGLGGSTALLANCKTERLSEKTEELSLSVGSLDLSQLEIIDVHLHPPQPMTLSKSYEGWNSSFVNAMLPSYDYPGKEQLRAKLGKVFEKHLYNLPRQTGYNNYMARVYGISPTIEDFDQVVSKHLADFTGYIRMIFDREKIPVVVLQSRESEPIVPQSYIPSDRFVWTYAFTDFIQPQWAKSKGIKNIQDVVLQINQIIDKAVANKCVGLKTDMSYFRPLSIQRVDESQASTALKSLLGKEPSTYFPSRPTVPVYEDPKLTESLKFYQDYILKKIFVKAGEVGLPIIIHVAAALHPSLRTDWNNALGLYEIFLDDNVLQAETQFILIHTGYPHHHVTCSMLSQFPNVFTDVSFYSKFPGILEETLRTFLSLAPSEKVMHGSDSNNVPEEIGYCASNTRRVLAKVLNDFKHSYGWTEKDCEKIARNVMSENARRVFKIKT